MQADRMPRRVRGDAAAQRAVLSLVLEAHPKPLTIPELAREIGPQDAIEPAVRGLVAIGLLECNGGLIKPTAATIYFDRLELP